MKINESKVAFDLLSFFGIGTFQWATANLSKNFPPAFGNSIRDSRLETR
jgi:hypothetical protein